jgi:hypothetical protein
MITANTTLKYKQGNIFKALVAFGLFLVCFCLLSSGRASAETNTPITAIAPTQNSGTTSGGTDFTPITGVGYGNFDGQFMWYKVYVKVGQSTTVNVRQTCADSFGNPTVEYSMQSLGDTEFNYAGNFGGNVYISPIKKSSDCTQTISFNISATAGIPSSRLGHTDYRVFAFLAQIEKGPGSAEQYFTVASSNGAPNTYVGMAKKDWSDTDLKYSTIYRPSGTWGASIMFAPRCDQSINNPVEIKVYDPDNGIYQDNMHAYLERSDIVPYMDSGAINWSTQTSWTAQQVQGVPNGFQWAQSGTTGTLNFNANNNYIYKFHIQGAAHPNTIQIGLPFDQFDAKQTARKGCFPAVTCTAVASPGSVQPGGQSTITIVGSSSSGQWPSSYYIRRSSPGAVKNITSPGDNTGTDTVTPPATTTYKYFVASSQPRLTTNDLAGGPAIHSTPCQVIVTVGSPNISMDCQNVHVANIKGTQVYVGPPPGIEPAPAPRIPIRLVMTGNGLNQTVYQWITVSTANGNETPTPQNFNTFTTFTGAWPHNAGYTVSLTYVSRGDYPAGASPATAYNTTGNTFADGGNADLGAIPCMQPTACSTNTQPNPIEVGQPVQYIFTITIRNSSQDSFSGGNGRQYNFNASGSGGVVINPPTSQTKPIPAGPSNSLTVTVTFSGTLNSGGTYSIAMVPADGSNANLLASIPNCSNSATPYAFPYLQAWNGSVSAGGGFRSPGIKDTGSCGASADPPYYSPRMNGNQNSGGIEAFGKQASNRGSKTDFGALALGYIIGSPSGTAGFYSGDQAAGDRMVYANNLAGFFSTNMGGYLNGVAPGHCASDFYTNTQVSQTSQTPEQGSLSADITNCQNQNNGNRCQFVVPSSQSVITAGVTFPAGFQITIYSDHDVTISGNIAYDNFDATQQASVPYFALVVRGNITVASSVRQLDGLYIAQPLPPTPPSTVWAGGTFATCETNTICNTQLVVNGAVIAQEVDLLRNHGTLSGGSDPQITGNPAEVFNFVPSLIIGQPAFATTFGQPQGVFNLPPVF